MTIKAIHLQTDTLKDVEVLETFERFNRTFAICKHWIEGKFCCVLFDVGVILVDTISSTPENTSIKANKIIDKTKMIHFIGVETGTIGYCMKQGFEYPINQPKTTKNNEC